MTINLNFINRSNDANNSQIVIFQKNVATDFAETSIAWTVIQNCGQGDNHPFTYPITMAVGANDSYGNYMPQLPATDGELFHVSLTTSGDTLSNAGQGTSSTEVQVRNDLAKGAIDASI